jgi:hypothetical protein
MKTQQLAQRLKTVAAPVHDYQSLYMEEHEDGVDTLELAKALKKFGPIVQRHDINLDQNVVTISKKKTPIAIVKRDLGDNS